MPVEEHRRVALFRAAADSWRQEVAETMFELVAPSGHELATRADIDLVVSTIEAMDERWGERFATMDEKWTQQLAAMDEKWTQQLAAMDENWTHRQDASEQRLTVSFERGIREAIPAQTRTLVLSQLGALVVIAGLAFGLSG
jgi:hypothetical protein